MELLTITEAAEKLKVSRSTVRRLIASGDLPYYKIRSCKRVSTEDLCAYLKDRRTRREGMRARLSIEITK